MIQNRLLATAACLLAGNALLLAQSTTVTVPGGDYIAVCVTSTTGGTWTFTVTSVTGKISYVQPQIYSNSHPTKTSADPTGPYRLCVSCSKAAGRAQAECFDDVSCSTSGSQEANFKIMNPSAGSSGSVTVSSPGPFCVRLYAAGKSGTSATVLITPP